jgi:glyoxylase-like metal-dependent hydrolase (beta-lactamase superfamily II)
MAKMKLYVMYAGRIDLPDKSHMTPGKDVGQPLSMPVYTYLIEHPQGLVLVDTGEGPGGPAVVGDKDIVTARLAQLGYTNDDIDYVIMTHLHVDHAAYMALFPHATFVVRKEEMRAAWWPEACEGGYVYDHYKDCRDFRYLQLKDDETFDLFMDGAITLIDTKGHTRGHQSVILNLENSGKLILVGDAASLRENLDDKILPGNATNSWAAMESLDRLRHYQDIGYTLFFGHDPEQAKSLKLSPDFYD